MAMSRATWRSDLPSDISLKRRIGKKFVALVREAVANFRRAWRVPCRWFACGRGRPHAIEKSLAERKLERERSPGLELTRVEYDHQFARPSDRPIDRWGHSLLRRRIDGFAPRTKTIATLFANRWSSCVCASVTRRGNSRALRSANSRRAVNDDSGCFLMNLGVTCGSVRRGAHPDRARVSLACLSRRESSVCAADGEHDLVDCRDIRALKSAQRTCRIHVPGVSGSAAAPHSRSRRRRGGYVGVDIHWHGTRRPR